MPHIEDGVYRANVLGATTAEAQSGSGQLVLDLEFTAVAVQHDDGNPFWRNYGPLRERCYLSLSDKAMPFTRGRLDKLGFNGNFSEPSFANGDDAVFQVSHEEYQGKVRQRIDVYTPRQTRPASRALLDRIQAMYKRAAESEQAPKPPARANKPKPSKKPDAAQSEAPQQPGATDADGIPF